MLKQKFALTALAAAAILPMAVAAPAQAQRYGYNDRAQYERNYDYDRGQYQRSDTGGYTDGRVYRGYARRNYQDCRRSSGTTGLIAGGAGGAVLGSVLGGGTLGTILGAVGGGLLGKSLDQKHDRSQNYRNGC
ncbi:hypothetical protein E2E30_05450 [Sphingomonas sp. AAP5]|uniref:hypothetical protein n=1 Tax=Sphingomonas sp. AAP5 TaxID=1523415 RepID=UPI0010571170|nr:hypothetical protein [Sphingomonas sp. AAP5]QBM75264.1 hypothetical protein E2E30_05450 [Sphingomonas sp. AAP5]